MRTIEGSIGGTPLKPAIIAGRFNAFVADRLVEGAVDAFRRTGSSESDITLYRAPGAFEIPQVLRRALDAGTFDCVVCIGAVIRGGTPHFEYVATSVVKGITDLATSSPIPVTLGLLTCDTVEQAIERSGAKAGNKGFDAAMAAVEMVSLARAMD